MSVKLSDKNWKENIEFIDYVSSAMKEAIIIGDGDNEGIVSECLDKREGSTFINYFLRDALLAIVLVREYTNVEFESGDELVDNIFKSNVVNIILQEIPDAKLFVALFDKCLKQEVEIRNSLSGIVASALEKIIERIPKDIDAKKINKWIRDIPKAFEKLSPENKEILKKTIE